MSDKTNKRTEILQAANDAINGPRNDSYGSATESFERIAALLNAAGFSHQGGNILPHDVAIMMSLVKIARLVASSDHEDSWMDLAGYAALGAEVAL